jgi:succinate dehydrogenase / fumarate reductase iron-sulfur subunit
MAMREGIAGQAAGPRGGLVRLRIRRQSRPDVDHQAAMQELMTEARDRGFRPRVAPNVRWEEFEVPYREGMNVISCLQAIQRNPITAGGQPTDAVVWENNCLEGVCGSCAMVINGRARMACTALVDQIEQPITLEPMRAFPVVRDLIVERTRMFEALKRVRAWIPIDGTYDLGPGPRIAPAAQQEAYLLSTCMTCGVCLEACPNVGRHLPFIGPAAINQVRLFNSHPTGRLNREERLEALQAEGGIAFCGNAQNCVRACPKGIPLTESIAEVNRQVNRHALIAVFRK